MWARSSSQPRGMGLVSALRLASSRRGHHWQKVQVPLGMQPGEESPLEEQENQCGEGSLGKAACLEKIMKWVRWGPGAFPA